jgi:hypothetical protein
MPGSEAGYRIAQIGTLKFAFEMFGFMTDDQFRMARNAELDPHHGRNCARAVFRPLVDANPAGNQPTVNFLQFGDVCASSSAHFALLLLWNAISRGTCMALSGQSSDIFVSTRDYCARFARGDMDVR